MEITYKKYGHGCYAILVDGVFGGYVSKDECGRWMASFDQMDISTGLEVSRKAAVENLISKIQEQLDAEAQEPQPVKTKWEVNEKNKDKYTGNFFVTYWDDKQKKTIWSQWMSGEDTLKHLNEVGLPFTITAELVDKKYSDYTFANIYMQWSEKHQKHFYRISQMSAGRFDYIVKEVEAPDEEPQLLPADEQDDVDHQDETCDICGGTGRIADDILCWKCEEPLVDEKQMILQDMRKMFEDAGIQQDEIESGIKWISEQKLDSIKAYHDHMIRRPDLIRVYTD